MACRDRSFHHCRQCSQTNGTSAGDRPRLPASMACVPQTIPMAASRTYSQFPVVYHLGDLSQYVYQEPRRRHG